ncbi:MAG: ATP-binding protein [Polyangiales bacterium]
MDALLNRLWPGLHDGRPTIDDASVSVAREDVRALAAELGFDTIRVGELAIAVSELATNQLRHAKLGRIALRKIARDGVAGIEMVAADRGPGIADPRSAIAGIPRTHGSLGTGLSSVLRFTDEVDFDVRIGEGTVVFARRFVAPVRRRRSIAILGRPHPHETRSGDDAWFHRDDDRLRFVLADGLGHGPLARDAARALIAHVGEMNGDPARVLDTAHEKLASTRGAVAAVCDIDENALTVTTAALGNVIVQVIGGRSVSGTNGVIGGTPPRKRAMLETQTLAGRGIVIAFTDGLTSRLQLDVFSQIALDHPLAIAHHLLESFGRDTDDATVVVVA